MPSRPSAQAALGLGVVGARSAMSGDRLIDTGSSTGMSGPAKSIDLTSGQSQQTAGDFLPIPIVPSRAAGGGGSDRRRDEPDSTGKNLDLG